MSNITDEKYERFKTNLEAVNGSCERTSKAELGKKIADLFVAQGLKDVCVNETPFLKEAGVVDALKAAGVEVFTDHIRLHGETVKGGISEMHGGIAELGTMMQFSDAINGRLVAIMSEDFFGVLPASLIVDTYDEMFDRIDALGKDIPGYVGFITGPSRTADIECVGTVGVHGPLRATCIIVEDA